MKLPEFAVRRPHTVMMIFLGIALMGAISLAKLNLDFLPEIEPPAISVLVPYPGAAASDVESDVTKYLEDQLSTVNNLDKLRSLSKDNISMVTCQFDWGTNLDVASNDVRDKLDLAKPDIREHAPDAEEPMIFKFSSATAPIMAVTFSATESYKQLHRIVDKKVLDPLKRVKGVGAIMMYGGLQREIKVEFDKRRLAGYGVALPEIIQKLAAENIDMPAGDVKMGTRRYQIRLKGRFQTPEAAAGIIVGTQDGRLVRLRDVANITDGFEEPRMHAWGNGRNGIVVIIQKQSGANTVAVCKAIRERLRELKKNLPADVDYAIPMDNSEFIINSISNLSTTLLVAGLLVIVVTVVFLRRVRASLIILLVIPFSLIIAFIFLFLGGYTINVISLMSLSVAIGMVVDNAVVVLENITRHVEQGGERPAEAAVFGTSEVGTAVVTGTLTTIAVFAPLIFVSGLTGIVFYQLAFIVSITLAGSLFAALTLTPMLASKWMKPADARKPSRLYQLSERTLGALDEFYERLLGTSLGHRKKILALLAVVFVASLGLLPFMGTDLFPDTDTGDIDITVALDESARLEESARVAQEIDELFERFVPEVRDRYAFCGESKKGIGLALGLEEGTNIARSGAKVVKKRFRQRSANEIAASLREEVKKIPGIQRMKVTATTPIKQLLMGGGKQVEVEITGHDMDATGRLVEQARKIFERTPGAVDITVSRKKPRQEVHVVVDRQKAASLGVNVATVAQVLRSNYYGFEATKYRDAGDDFNVFVRLDESNRCSLDDIGEVDIPSADDDVGSVRLKNIASIIYSTGPVEIKRKNRERIVTVGADVYKRSLGEVKADVALELGKLEIPSGVTVELGGEVEEQRKAFRDLTVLLVVGMILVYMVMASQFESLKTPFVIAFSIPFAFTGVIWAFYLTGVTLSIMSFMAIIMLIGVVVKNAIVLIDYTNILRARGLSLHEAVVQAGRHRLRPILMTTLTTLFGMLPLAISHGEGAEVWQSFGITAIGGLSLSTVVTLLLVPIIYTYFEQRGERRKGAPAQ
jgi:HAE1 family hydrophobic/amphiphilic exporter-1